jgi:hypothetical protein
MKKYLNIGLIVLLAVAVLSVITWLAAGGANTMDAKVDFMLWVAFVYLILAVGVLVVMMIMNLGKSKGNSKLGLVVYGVMIVAAVILYFVGSAKALTGADGTVFDHVFTLKSTDMMLYLTYIALIAVVGILLWGEIRKAIK